MHRSAVLKQLTGYQAEALEAHESAVVDEMIRFVRTHDTCLLRSCLTGHLTGSAWIVDPTRTWALLTHHRKLDKWLQLGGHADGDPDLWSVALREAREESGLTRLSWLSKEIFDLDSHEIPERKGIQAHVHHDLRFLFEADPNEPLTVTDESKQLSWVRLDQVVALNAEESLARMVRKTLRSLE